MITRARGNKGEKKSKRKDEKAINKLASKITIELGRERKNQFS